MVQISFSKTGFEKVLLEIEHAKFRLLTPTRVPCSRNPDSRHLISGLPSVHVTQSMIPRSERLDIRLDYINSDECQIVIRWNPVPELFNAAQKPIDKCIT